jgi:mRNA-degrading endonuclease HigB of HigAB toxin-antitoxin module
VKNKDVNIKLGSLFAFDKVPIIYFVCAVSLTDNGINMANDMAEQIINKNIISVNNGRKNVFVSSYQESCMLTASIIATEFIEHAHYTEKMYTYFNPIHIIYYLQSILKLYQNDNDYIKFQENLKKLLEHIEHNISDVDYDFIIGLINNERLNEEDPKQLSIDILQNYFKTKNISNEKENNTNKNNTNTNENNTDLNQKLYTSFRQLQKLVSPTEFEQISKLILKIENKTLSKPGVLKSISKTINGTNDNLSDKKIQFTYIHQSIKLFKKLSFKSQEEFVKYFLKTTEYSLPNYNPYEQQIIINNVLRNTQNTQKNNKIKLNSLQKRQLLLNTKTLESFR